MNQIACMTTFITVVEKGGLAAAARHLGLAPATVTQQVHNLEGRIGVRLLQRTTRKSALTPAGQVFFERGVKILKDVREADAIANAYRATAKGTVRLNISPTLSNHVSAMIARYAMRYPDTSFELTTANRMGDLIDGRIDLAIRDDAVADSTSLVTRNLGYAEWTPCASPGYVARHGMPSCPEELVEHNCLVYAANQGRDEWRLMDGSGAKSIRISGSLRSADPQILRTAALSDHGVALLPEAMVDADLDAGRLVRVLGGCAVERVSIRALFASRHELALKVRTFLDFAAKDFAPSPKCGPAGAKPLLEPRGGEPGSFVARAAVGPRLRYPRLAILNKTGTSSAALASTL